MNSKDYWAKREAEALKHYIKDEKEYDRQIKQIYSDMLAGCTKEIEAFYGRYAAKEGITLAEAKKRVSKLDIEKYERKAAKYVKDKDFSDKANEELRLYNLTMKVNRLEMLKANIGLEMIAGHDELEKFMAGILKGRTEEELKRQAGILGKTIRNNARLAHTIPNASFHNGTFSDRIWQYQDLMREDLSKILSRGLIQGKNPRAIAKDLQKYWYGNDPRTGGGAVYCMERLMRTELARVQTEAQKQSFEKNGFTEYMFIANSGCCGDCKALDGKHFKVSKMMPGDNAAPLHPHCRCSVAAYEDSDEYEAWLDYLDKGGTTAEWEKLKAAKNTQQFREIKDAIDFQYGDYTEEDYNKWWDEYEAHNKGVSLSAEELKIIEDYTEGSFIGLNDVCRYSEAELLKKGYSLDDIARLRQKADLLSGALSKYDLDTDIVTHRFERNVSWLTGKGNDVADLEELIGSEYTAKSFTSSGMLANRFRFTGGKSDAVHFEIVTPKGTDGAFLSMSKKGENEFLYNRNTKFRVLDGGERVVKERKYNFKTGMFDEVDVTERFLKVQVIPDADDVIKATQKKKVIPAITKTKADNIAEEVIETTTKKAVKKSTFTPSANIKEAEDFIKKYVDDSVWAGTGVSYSGISIGSANVVNKTLSNLYNTYDIDKLGGVYVAKGNTKLGKAVEGATAAYSPVRKSLILNNRSLKKVDDIVKAHTEEIKWIKKYAENPSAFTFKSKRVEAIAKASIKSGRATVPNTIEDVIHHEMGHHIESVVMKSDDWATIKSNMSKYADKISGYATISDSEYIAESFASYLKGERLVDPKLADVFKNLKRSKTSGIIDSLSDEKIYLEKFGNSGIIISEKQFGKKIGRHAKDFNLNASLEADRQKMREIIDDIITNCNEQRTGSWRGQTEQVTFYIKGDDVVLVTSETNQFVSILKGGVTNERVKNARKR